MPDKNDKPSMRWRIAIRLSRNAPLPDFKLLDSVKYFTFVEWNDDKNHRWITAFVVLDRPQRSGYFPKRLHQHCLAFRFESYHRSFDNFNKEYIRKHAGAIGPVVTWDRELSLLVDSDEDIDGLDATGWPNAPVDNAAPASSVSPASTAPNTAIKSSAAPAPPLPSTPEVASTSSVRTPVVTPSSASSSSSGGSFHQSPEIVTDSFYRSESASDDGVVGEYAPAPSPPYHPRVSQQIINRFSAVKTVFAPPPPKTIAAPALPAPALKISRAPAKKRSKTISRDTDRPDITSVIMPDVSHEPVSKRLRSKKK